MEPAKVAVRVIRGLTTDAVLMAVKLTVQKERLDDRSSSSTRVQDLLHMTGLNAVVDKLGGLQGKVSSYLTSSTVPEVRAEWCLIGYR